MQAAAIITDVDFIICMGVFAGLDMVLSTWGLLANTINVKTIAAMGPDDGVTVSFLYLSLSEGLCCLLAFGQKLAMAFWVMEMATGYAAWFHVNPYVFNVLLGNIRTSFFMIPVLVTTFLAVAKCLCVVKPLGFRGMFPARTTHWVMISICVFSLVSYLPVITTIFVVDQFDEAVNATRLTVRFSPERPLIQNIINTSRESFTALASQIVIVVCIVIMTRALLRAVKLRDELRSGKLSEMVLCNSDDLTTRKTNRLSGKELRVIIQVTLISIVYIVSNTPKILVFLAIASVPELSQGGLYQNLYDVILKSKAHSELYLSAFNIFIYYKYNSKYRHHCKL
ncbi:unnamed protein product [Lymnaea stagnalis]|uniref:G-protein coupled receptors family 1 profile domain-containing protein n=1 Tax=Lymnaea stagnalis TaxID=6523 RepID=A0AAV2IIE6_LYMST